MRRAALLLCLLLAAACGATTGPGGVGSRKLAGREFVSDRVDGRSLVAGTEILIRFDERALSASAGCNSIGGAYRLEDFDGATGTIVVDGDGLSMTEIGCDAPRHDQDTWLADLLIGGPTVSLPDDDTMTLTAATSTIHFVDREVAEPDRPLTGTTWKVDSIITGDAVSSVPESGGVTFEFGGAGKLVVTSDTCTSVALSYERSGDRMTFGSYTVDDVGCPSPWAEALALLDTKAVAFTIDHARLTLTASGGRGLSLIAS